MPYPAGTRLGRYEILSPLGAGNMGEVYRARHLRLSKDVAIKALPESLCRDESRLRRFEQEARALGALNHPNILVVHDVDVHEGRPYLVTELLEGETLRERLSRSALPASKALDYALQMARGLAAAHARGIIHRDLKPANVFLTTDGLVKILDFGLAKARPGIGSALTVNPETTPGAILGTAGYMSPEQVRGQEADARSDIFSFGAVLYEMLSGATAFRGGSGYDAMNAVVQRDPPKLPDGTPPALERLVRCCVEKRPEDRFQSAHDLILALESCAAGARPRRWRIPLGHRWLGVAAAACLLALGLLAWWILRPPPPPQVVFTPLTFGHGTVAFARFTGDGQTVVYSAAWNAKPFQVYATRMDRPESWAVSIAHASNPLAIAVSSAGEMAFLLPREGVDLYTLHGTLARAPVAGGEPKEVMENVAAADWSPDGSKLAVARLEKGGCSLEYPPGAVLYRTRGAIDYVKVSPRGSQVAFLDHPLPGDLGGAVAVVDTTRRKRTLSRRYNSIRGLAWAKGGKEIWFSAADTGNNMGLYTVTLKGKERRLEDLKGYATLEDISRDGRALVVTHTLLRSMFFVPRGQTSQIDLCYKDASQVQDLAPDGSVILFAESGADTGRDFEAFLRRTDGSPPKRLGTGLPTALSPDGKWVIANPAGDPAQLVLLPTGAGAEEPLTHDSIHHLAAQWLPDGRQFVFVGSQPGGALRYWLQAVKGGSPRPITSDDVMFDRSFAPIVISPDGSQVAVLSAAGGMMTVPITGGAPSPVPGAEAGDVPLQWCGSRSLIVRRTGTIPVELYRIDLATGRRRLWRSLVPRDPVGLVSISPVRVSADCRSCAYTTLGVLSVLNVVSGLR